MLYTNRSFFLHQLISLYVKQNIPTTWERTLATPITRSLHLFLRSSKFQPLQLPYSISSQSHSCALLPSSVLVLFLSYSPISQNINHVHLQHQCFPCSPPKNSHRTHSCMHIATIFLPSLISTPSKMQSCFQIRWNILASELGKQRARSTSHFSFLRLASYFLPDKCPNVKRSRNFKAVFNVLNTFPSFFWLKGLQIH